MQINYLSYLAYIITIYIHKIVLLSTIFDRRPGKNGSFTTYLPVITQYNI